MCDEWFLRCQLAVAAKGNKQERGAPAKPNGRQANDDRGVFVMVMIMVILMMVVMRKKKWPGSKLVLANRLTTDLAPALPSAVHSLPPPPFFWVVTDLSFLPPCWRMKGGSAPKSQRQAAHASPTRL